MADQHPALLLLLYSGLTIYTLIPLGSWFMLQDQRDQNANLWFLGTGFYSLAAIFFVFSSALPLVITGPIISGMGLISILLLYESVRRETSSSPAKIPVYFLLVAAEMAVLVLTYSSDAWINWGRSMHLLLLAIVELVLTVQTNTVRKKFKSKSMLVVMATFILYIAINVSRVLEFVFTGQFSSLLSFSPLAQMALVISYLSVIFYCYGYWGFIVEKKQAEVTAAAQEAAASLQAELLANQKQLMTQELLRVRTEFMERLTAIGKVAHAGALSATIAHEMNQPLAAIQLNVEEYERIAASTPLPATITKLVSRIGFDSRRLAQTVKRVRAIFKQDSGVSEPLVLDDAVRNSVDLLSSHLKGRGIELQMQLQAPEKMFFPAGEMEHVLMNLINNAMEALAGVPSGQRRIAIASWCDADAVHLSVSDSGPGVPEGWSKRAFELSETTKPNGMGLGLWLARYIFERHGGKIWMDEDCHEGALFLIQFRLPSDRNIRSEDLSAQRDRAN